MNLLQESLSWRDGGGAEINKWLAEGEGLGEGYLYVGDCMVALIAYLQLECLYFTEVDLLCEVHCFDGELAA